MKRTAEIIASAAFLCALAFGCGSSGGAPGDGGATPDTGGTLGGGVLTWKENGAAHTALIASAALVHSSTLDLLQISAGDASGLGVALGIGVQPPPLVADSYACGGSGYPIVSFSFTGADGQPLTCAIDLSTVGTATGMHSVGTFSASGGVTGGGTKTITDGRFDLPTTVSSL